MRTFFESVSNSSIGSPIVLVAANSVLNESKLGIVLKTGVPLAAFGLGAYAYHNKDNIESTVNDALPTPEEKEKMKSDFFQWLNQTKLGVEGELQKGVNQFYNADISKEKVGIDIKHPEMSPKQEKDYNELEMARMSELMSGGK